MSRIAQILRQINAKLSPTRSLHKPPKQQRQFIAEAAYYLAEKRGFVAGFEEQDWAEAQDELGFQLTDHLDPANHREVV
jgi:hypothetical protein